MRRILFAIITVFALFVGDMKKVLFSGLVLAASTISLSADISMPVKDSFYDKLGRGIANTAFAVSEPLDSGYNMIDTEGETVAFTKGLMVQGISRMFMDMGHGVFEIVTSPFPLQGCDCECGTGSYRSLKDAPYDSMVVNDYPPADLKYWY